LNLFFPGVTYLTHERECYSYKNMSPTGGHIMTTDRACMIIEAALLILLVLAWAYIPA
jgi:hypothetical protein